MTRSLALRGWAWGVLVFAGFLAFAAGALAAEPNPLRVGVTPVFPPVIYREAGEFVGVEPDFAAALGRELGRPIEFVEVKWDEQFEALAERRTDIIMSCLSITKPRQFQAAFSRPYLTIGQMALVRRKDSAMYALGFPTSPENGIGVTGGTTGDFLVQQNFPRAKRRTYASGEKGAKALLKERIDMFICDAPTIYWLGSKYESEGLVVVPAFLTEEYLAWAVRKSDSELLESVNQALEKLQENGEAKKIIARWIPMFNP